MSTDLKKSRKLSTKRYVMVLIAILVVLLGSMIIKGVNELKGDLQNREQQLKQTQLQIQSLDKKLDDAEKNKNLSDQQIQQLEKEKQDLEGQLQAKAAEQTRLAELAAAAKAAVSPATAYAATVPSVTVAGCGDNGYANYIYMHESGCRTGITNSEGCIGIGQACPASKLINACPNLDYDCENSFFTSYAVGRYGSWEGAYNFWVNNHWW